MREEDMVIEGSLSTRPNRFIGKVYIEETLVEVFIPNPGRMHEFMIPGKTVYLRKNPGPQRRTDYDMIALLHDDVLVSIDTRLANQFMNKLLLNHQTEFFGEYDSVRSEPTVYNGRFDFELQGRNRVSYVEVKSCTLVENGIAYFPDAVTERGARHMHHLSKALEDGFCSDAFVVFVIQRPDANEFRPQDHRDPKFGEALRKAHVRGVQLLPLLTELKDWNLKLIRRIKYQL